MSNKTKQSLLLVISCLLWIVMISFGLYAKNSGKDYTILCVILILISMFIFSKLKALLEENGSLTYNNSKKNNK